MTTRIKTPDEVQVEQGPSAQKVLNKVNAALVSGRRSFFQSMAGGESDIPPGYMTQVKSALEKAGWIVEVVGTGSIYHLDVRGPNEIWVKK